MAASASAPVSLTCLPGRIDGDGQCQALGSASAADDMRPVAQGSDPREYGKQYEVKLRQAELESIEDYIVESKNLVTLHEQARPGCGAGCVVALCCLRLQAD